MAGVAVGDDWHHVVDGRGGGGLSAQDGGGALLVLATVVVGLCPEELVAFVGDGVHGVVGEVGSGLIGGGGG